MRIRPTASFRLLVLTTLALMVSGQPEIAAQADGEVKVTANVLSNRVAIGEFGTLIVEVTGAEARLPQRIDSEKLEISHSGEQSSIEIVNRLRTIKFTHFYRFRGSEPGTFTIPPIEVTLPNETRMTPAIEVTVYERDGSEAIDATRPYFAKLELNRTEFYVNEVVPFTVIAYVRGRNAISDVVQPRFQHESFVIKNFRDVRTDGGELGSTYYSSAVLPSSLFALKAGEHRLGPADLGVRVLDASSGFGFSSFFSRTVVREMATNTVNVKVKPLPDGAPLGFSGAVGSFQLSVEPSTTQVSVGDPISMKFRVSGTGNRQTMSAPVFQTPQTGLWKSYEPSKQIEEGEGNDGFASGSVAFSQVILPEAKVMEIPPFIFSYFDPVAEEYVSRITEPIPIEVSSDPNRNVAPAISFPRDSSGAAATPAAAQPEPNYEDMLFIRATKPRWISATALNQKSWIHYAVHGFFSICFFTLLGFGILRSVQQRKLAGNIEGPPESFADALHQIPGQGASRRDYYRAVATALACWKSEHEDAPEPVLEVIQRVSEKCDQFLYSGQSEGETPISPGEANEFQSILQKLPRK